MDQRKTFIGTLCLGLALILIIGMTVAQAQTPRQSHPVRPDDALQQTQALAVGSAFTYQGQLEENGSPVNGLYDLQFMLYDAASGGSQVGSSIIHEDITLADGRFTVQLNFGYLAFTGGDRWLEIGVRPGSSSGADPFTILSPRQPLTATPYAFHAVNADLLDGSHASAFASASHDHLGQTWTGSNNALKVGGSFSAPDYAPLALTNSAADGDGLRVTSTGDDGVQVSSAGGDGLFVDTAGEDGVRVESAGRDGVYVYEAVRDGFTVFSAGSDGVYVGGVGNYSSYDYSGEQHGFEVAGAEGSGLRVGRADDDGVHIHNAGDNGVYVGTAFNNGVDVSSAGDTGVLIGMAGNPATTMGSSESNGVAVGGAEANGLYVGWADDAGVYVDGGGIGLEIREVGGNGVYVNVAGDNGFYVGSAGLDGLRINSAGHDFINAGGNLDPEFRVLNTGEVRSDVGYTTPANDFAEMMVVEGNPAGYEPGDVLVISGAEDRAVALSSTPFARDVIGVYSTAPGFVGGSIVSDAEQTDRAPVAILGLVPCKVSTENGAIQRGDLLVTSGTPGHAMRVDDAPPGTILGKALQSLDASQDTGVILVLVTLQ